MFRHLCRSGFAFIFLLSVAATKAASSRVIVFQRSRIPVSCFKTKIRASPCTISVERSIQISILSVDNKQLWIDYFLSLNLLIVLLCQATNRLRIGGNSRFGSWIHPKLKFMPELNPLWAWHWATAGLRPYSVIWYRYFKTNIILMTAAYYGNIECCNDDEITGRNQLKNRNKDRKLSESNTTLK